MPLSAWTALWFFTSCLSEKLQVEQCADQPAMFPIPASDGGGVLLVHVDDVLFLAGARYVQEKLLPVLKSTFKVSMLMAPRTGGSLFFLEKRTENMLLSQTMIVLL